MLSDVVCSGRFFDFLDRRDGHWGMVLCQPIYERDRSTRVASGTRLALDEALLARFPEGYRHLAYVQTRIGYPVKTDMAGITGPRTEALYALGRAWLANPGTGPGGTLMRAVRIVKYGGPDDLVIEEIPDGEPAPGEVLVEVRAAAVNPVDLANLAGKVQAANGTAATVPPRTAGRDYAGVVVAGPPGLIGQEVWGTSGELGVGRPGAQAGLLAVPADSVSAKPAGLSFAEAAAVGVSYTAAWLCLSARADVQAGETVLVTGAAGVVGRAATQIAHWRGARVIGADLNVADDLAADIIIDTSKKDLVSAVRDATGGAGVDAAVDTVGGPLFDQMLATLRRGGRSVVIASTGSPVTQVNLLELYRNERSVYGVNTLDLPLAKAASILDVLRRGFDSGVLRAPRTLAFPLEEAAAAYKTVLSGTGGAKVVLRP